MDYRTWDPWQADWAGHSQLPAQQPTASPAAHSQPWVLQRLKSTADTVAASSAAAAAALRLVALSLTESRALGTR